MYTQRAEPYAQYKIIPLYYVAITTSIRRIMPVKQLGENAPSCV